MKIIKTGTNRDKLNSLLAYAEDLYEQVEALKVEVAELKAVAPKPETFEPEPFVPAVKDPVTGAVGVDPDLEPYAERMAQRQEGAALLEAQRQAKLRKGLPDGYCRDAFGLIRQEIEPGILGHRTYKLEELNGEVSIDPEPGPGDIRFDDDSRYPARQKAIAEMRAKRKKVNG